ncbi:MAG: hypothetical protein AB1453_07390 [Chloroflexota bacterium]|jgi:hypothetical protein
MNRKFNGQPSSSLESTSKPATLADLLLTPLGCLIRSPLLFLAFFLVGFLVWSVSTGNLTGLWAVVPEFDTWQIDHAFTTIEDEDGEIWKIRYESKNATTFEGLIRHASAINERAFPLLSHDILVTSGQFADKQAVRTSVSNHRFYWYTDQSSYPQGKINLLHTVPSSPDIYQQLAEVKSGQQVRITGIEILDIARYDQQGKYLGAWADAGCNTLLVTSVEIFP